MKCSDDIPWPSLHDFVVKAGSTQDQDEFWEVVLQDLPKLVPFDVAQVVFRDRNGDLERMKTVELPERFVRTYPAFYKKMRKAFFLTRLPFDPLVFSTTSRPFQLTEFGQEWVRPLGFAFSAGIAIDKVSHGSPLLVILYRTACRGGFSQLELQILGLLQRHLQNLYQAHLRTCWDEPDKIAARIDGVGHFTKREKEIAAFLCQGRETSEMSTKLFISPATVYRHISNIFEKMEVSNRQTLIAKLLGTCPDASD